MVRVFHKPDVYKAYPGLTLLGVARVLSVPSPVHPHGYHGSDRVVLILPS